MKDAMNELYAKYDAIVTPGRASVALPIEGDWNKAWPECRAVRP